MRIKMAVAGIAVVAATSGPWAPGAGAGAGQTRVVAGPGGAGAGYATPVAVAQRGKAAVFRNLDIVAHDVVSVRRNSSGPLFRTPLIGLNKEAVIAGVPSLPVGNYAFFCTLHTNMKGFLRVV